MQENNYIDIGHDNRIVKLLETNPSEDKIIIGTDSSLGVDCYITLALLCVTTQDFNPFENTSKFLDTTSSFQIRPKSLYRSSRGVYYKVEDGRRYLSNQEIINICIANPDIKKFLR